LAISANGHLAVVQYCENGGGVNGRHLC
jgi:hypothetical protein